MTSTQPWYDLLSEADRSRMESARFGRRVGFGERSAVLVIDAQRYMVGEPGAPEGAYPSACPTAPEAIERLAQLLEAARSASAPVIYTQFILEPDGSDAGVYARKRDLLNTEGWCLSGTKGAEIVPELRPQASDLVLVKKKPSAFIGTPLLSLLIDRGIDTVLVTGGSTSNCVRATAVDAASYNYRTLVPMDCVFDRFDISHRVALFDIDRQYGDVIQSDEAIAEFRRKGEE